MSSIVTPLPATGGRRIPSKSHNHKTSNDSTIITSFVSGMDPVTKVVQPPVTGELSSSPKLNSSSSHNTKLFASTYSPPQPTHSERHASSSHTINQPR
ncbi:hypothetical protein PPL_06207 [Heterostelium album PN500]|uniref:Uncharacterized protein n=1 Tax=Heterostelium pallidum (strain ATCC 26659 / Pp 5 / PN500) TaxID=670386 RepID=D3BCI2_HETP5|nr:hypothetical protein PPL_06207 [Heterostelium album PN500]EFA80624.1 hypothetical protein PPL_06207 [Heterostelium album PN500]|eukprot:XP_020432744.1 hypothetical protein PPL_06207 [Heterostelium album PN500]